ncbi:MAG: hypothetical protein K0R27_337 [Xanthobacteraceae bacterium]|jgi:hypothetical protein|nr:hypothetical protein [Xanthobacteraceae bacterium]
MTKGEHHHEIDFAKRYFAVEESTLDAASALYRLELLIDDAQTVAEHLQPLLQGQIAPAFFEFVSYYNVGFVTCLEWHAKSRLSDLISYDPKQIIELNKSIKNNVNTQLAVLTITEGLTIPNVLGGSIRISTFDAYIGALKALLKRFKDTETLDKALDAKYKGTQIRKILVDLYEVRNSLVHEIDLSKIGHWNIRSYSTFQDVLDNGKAIEKFVKRIERRLTQIAPEDFPNLLNSRGFPKDDVARLAREIRKLEKKISDSIASNNIYADLSVEEWNKLIRKSRSYIRSHLTFINGLYLPGQRYYDVRPYMKKTLLTQRVQYLNVIVKQLLGDSDATDGDEAAP